MTRRHLRPLKHRRVKMIVWDTSQAVGVWYDERKQLLRLAGHMKSEGLGKALLQLARDEARSIGVPRADGPELYVLVGGNRWRRSLYLPRCRGILDLIERAIRAGKLPNVRIMGPVRALGRLTY